MAIPECKMGAISPSILAGCWKVGCEGGIHGFSRHYPNGTGRHDAGRSAVTARFPAAEMAESVASAGTGHRFPRAKGR